VMTDIVDKKTRSRMMSNIKGKNTKPELIVRSIIHRWGFRFCLHSNDLPGKPDIVLPKYGTVIFVHGYFWHRHPRCKYAYTPKSRVKFWNAKFIGNIERDKSARMQLQRLGWQIIVVWECQTKDLKRLTELLESKLFE